MDLQCASTSASYRYVAWLSGYAGDICYHEPFQQNLSKTMFQKRRLTNSGAAASDADLNRCEWIVRLPRNQLFNSLNPPAKRQRVVDGAKILLDIAKESADWFPPLKSALGGVNALIKHYEVVVGSVAVAHN